MRKLVRCSVIVGGMSKRAAAREYGFNRRTVDKMGAHSVPQGYVPVVVAHSNRKRTPIPIQSGQ